MFLSSQHKAFGINEPSQLSGRQARKESCSGFQKQSWRDQPQACLPRFGNPFPRCENQRTGGSYTFQIKNDGRETARMADYLWQPRSTPACDNGASRQNRGRAAPTGGFCMLNADTVAHGRPQWETAMAAPGTGDNLTHVPVSTCVPILRGLTWVYYCFLFRHTFTWHL